MAPRETPAPTTTTIHLYDEVGFWGISADTFVRDLAAVDTPRVDLHINSPGGDVWDGLAMFNALADHPAEVHVTVDGIAASAASFIAMAGDTVTVNRAAQVMIHDAAGLCLGNAAAMREVAGLLDKASNSIASIYARRAGGTVEAWRGAMRAETWYTGPEAVAAGLADTALDSETTDVADPWDELVERLVGSDPRTEWRRLVAPLTGPGSSSASSAGDPGPPFVGYADGRKFTTPADFNRHKATAPLWRPGASRRSSSAPAPSRRPPSTRQSRTRAEAILSHAARITGQRTTTEGK